MKNKWRRTIFYCHKEGVTPACFLKNLLNAGREGKPSASLPIPTLVSAPASNSFASSMTASPSKDPGVFPETFLPMLISDVSLMKSF
ncbi:MAG: hypothetical protein BGN92_12315 [Sphingobacteriales bacterium 41-5]|nr:MAG: hypothetical protein BGN92_12315 [Sphingobacteriales bacterium 41-5]